MATVSEVKRAYRFRFYPTPKQENLLRRTLGCCRKVYNMALDVRTEAWTQRKERVGYAETSRMLAEWKKTDDLSYLTEVSAVALQQALRHLQSAFKNFYDKTGAYPKHKAKRHGGSATFQSNAYTWNWAKQELTLAKMDKPLDIRWSRTIPHKTKPSSVTVSLDPAGRWHVSILCEDTIPHLPTNDRTIGIDLGLEHFAIMSAGTKVDNPRHLQKNLKRLELAQQALSRKQKGSRNHEKARLKAAKAYAKVKDSRKDFLHKLSTSIIRDNQTVVIEDLAVRNMSKTVAPKPDPDDPDRCLPNGQTAKSHLNRSILDAGWREFRTMLEYKCAWYGRTLTVIDRYYPSSRLCSTCGKSTGEKPLDVREWTCPYCETRHDRDVNAAKNILSAGLAVRACGDHRLANATLR